MFYNEGQGQILPPSHYHTSLPFIATQRPVGQQSQILASDIAESSNHAMAYLSHQSQNQMYTSSAHIPGPATQTHSTFPHSYFTPINQSEPKKFRQKCQEYGDFNCPGSQKHSNCQTKQ